MKTIFKKNKHNKDGPIEKADCLNIDSHIAKIQDEEKSEKKAFIAWPENKPSATIENGSIEIIEGRTKNGGYVAYPKEAVKDESHYSKG